MRMSRFTEEQIVAVLKEGEAGLPMAEVVRKHGISRNTYFNWKAKYKNNWIRWRGSRQTYSSFNL